MMDCILAIDAGGTAFKFAYISSDGTLGQTEQIPVCSNGAKEDIFDAYRQVIARVKSKGYPIKGIGISTPGPFDFRNGQSLMRHKFAALYGLPLREIISKMADGVPVWFCHDANAFLAGELQCGAACNEKNVVCITLGTGLGAAIAKDGCVLTNEIGGPREILYNRPCIKGGILEDYASGRGIVSYYKTLSGKASNNTLTAKDIAALAKTDVYAKQAYDEMGEILGFALRDIVEKYQTECVVLGGQIAHSFSLMKDGIARGLDMPDVRILKAKNLDSAALYGITALTSRFAVRKIPL